MTSLCGGAKATQTGIDDLGKSDLRVEKQQAHNIKTSGIHMRRSVLFVTPQVDFPKSSIGINSPPQHRRATYDVPEHRPCTAHACDQASFNREIRRTASIRQKHLRTKYLKVQVSTA